MAAHRRVVEPAIGAEEQSQRALIARSRTETAAEVAIISYDEKPGIQAIGNTAARSAARPRNSSELCARPLISAALHIRISAPDARTTGLPPATKPASA